MSDGCGAILHCGGCTAPKTCGGGGTANVCGCNPTTCAKEGKNCGSIPNGCGGTLSCGSCASPSTCGGDGTANVCGCTPTTTHCAAGQDCGTVPNGCGANIACGTCKAPETCGGGGTTNRCGCTPLTCADFTCGIHPDGCGRYLSCGLCGGGGCFVAGTRVTMADGSTKPIETVVPGDRVRSTDPDTGALGTAVVTARNTHGTGASEDGIVVVDGRLRATRNHPIWVNGRVVPMEQLRPGDVIVTSGPLRTTVRTRVTSVTLERGGVPTYDLVLKGGNDYFADGVAIQQKQIPEEQ
jgi:hypothetical protein